MMMIISLLALATACSDDSFDPYGREGSLEFDNGTTYSVLHLNVPGDWTAEASRSRATDRPSQRRARMAAARSHAAWISATP